MTDLTHWRTVHRETMFAGGPIEEVAVESVQLPDGPTIPDYDVEFVSPVALLHPAGLHEIGLASHVALLLLATHPVASAAAGRRPRLRERVP